MTLLNVTETFDCVDHRIALPMLLAWRLHYNLSRQAATRALFSVGRISEVFAFKSEWVGP
jgi:hypothetical protein